VAQVVEVQARHADRLDGVWQADILLKLPRRSGPPLAPGKTSAPAEKHHDGGGRAAPVNGEKDAR
jgi:hypothetical protein